MITFFYIYLAISNTTNEIASNTNVSFHVLLTHSLYGTFKYSRANTNIPSQRINLYQTSYPEDNNLLNFELDGATACSSKENDNFTASCLRAELSSGSTFNEKNLSNYNFKNK